MNTYFFRPGVLYIFWCILYKYSHPANWGKIIPTSCNLARRDVHDSPLLQATCSTTPTFGLMSHNGQWARGGVCTHATYGRIHTYIWRYFYGKSIGKYGCFFLMISLGKYSIHMDAMGFCFGHGKVETRDTGL